MTNYLNILSELDESPEKLYKRHTGFTVHSNDNDDSSDDDTKQSALKDLAKYKPPPYTFQELKYDFLSETDSDGDVPISENKDQKDDSLGGWVSIGELRRKSDSNAENDVVIKTKKKRSRKKKPAIEVTSTEPVVPSCETICQKLKELLTNDKCFICHKEGGRKHYRKTGHYKNVKLWLDSQCKGYFDQKLLFCEVCNQPLNGTLESMAHYQEDEHKINVESFCTICVRSMDPADLKRHYEMKHPELSKLNTNKSPSASTLSLTVSSLGEQSEDSGSRKTKRKRYRKESSLVEDIVTEMTGNDFVEIVNSLADDEHFCSFCNKIGKRSSHFKTKSHYERVIELLNLSPEVFRPIPYKQFMCLPCLYVFRGGDSISEHFKDPIHKIESQYFCPQCLVHDNSLVHRQHKNWWSEAQVHFEMKGRLLDIEMKKYENFVQVPEQGKSVIEVTTPKTKVPQYIDSLHRPKPVRSPSPYPGLSNGDRWIRLTPVNDPLSPRDSPSQTKFPSVDKPKVSVKDPNVKVLESLSKDNSGETFWANGDTSHEDIFKKATSDFMHKTIDWALLEHVNNEIKKLPKSIKYPLFEISECLKTSCVVTETIVSIETSKDPIKNEEIVEVLADIETSAVIPNETLKSIETSNDSIKNEEIIEVLDDIETNAVVPNETLKRIESSNDPIKNEGIIEVFADIETNAGIPNETLESIETSNDPIKNEGIIEVLADIETNADSTNNAAISSKDVPTKERSELEDWKNSDTNTSVDSFEEVDDLISVKSFTFDTKVPDDKGQCDEMCSRNLPNIPMEIILEKLFIDVIDIVAAIIILYVFSHYLFPF